MRTFTDEHGRSWVADVREEDTPRHHGRWYLVFRAADSGDVLVMPEVRWQTRESADRTLATMSLFELRRRIGSVVRRLGARNR